MPARGADLSALSDVLIEAGTDRPQKRAPQPRHGKDRATDANQPVTFHSIQEAQGLSQNGWLHFPLPQDGVEIDFKVAHECLDDVRPETVIWG
jgi:hypothetical protein